MNEYQKRLEIIQKENPFLSLTQAVHRILAECIIAMEFKPGERLSVNKISQILNISRSPVTSAVEELIKDTLVIDKKGRYYISYIDEREYKDLFDCVLLFESYAAGEAAIKMTDHQLEELHELSKKLYEVYHTTRDFTNDPESLVMALNLEINFHNKIIEASGNELLIKMYDDIKYRILRFRSFCLYATRDDWYKKISADHRIMVEILKLRDRELAETIARKHVSEARIHFESLPKSVLRTKSI